jgi:molybdate transport system substrate-binding protein
MRRLLVLIAVFGLCAAGAAEEIIVAAAADLSFAVKELAVEFEHKTGHKVKVSRGSSGNFYSQIRNGAPFDVFMSADLDYPKRLEAEGLVEPGSIYRYAVGRIVLWTAKGSRVDVQRGMGVLLDPAVRKIAIANPTHAPYGRAAVSAMTAARAYEQIKDKLVFGENVAQAAQFVDSGNADVGVIALSLAVAPTMKDRGSYWEIPAASYPAIAQGAAILRSSKHKQAAQAFLEFLKSKEAVEILRKHGFSLR